MRGFLKRKNDMELAAFCWIMSNPPRNELPVRGGRGGELDYAIAGKDELAG